MHERALMNLEPCALLNNKIICGKFNKILTCKTLKIFLSQNFTCKWVIFIFVES